MPRRLNPSSWRTHMGSRTMPVRLRYALTLVSGLDAMARCQYAWSSQTVEKLPRKITAAYLIPVLDWNVSHEP